MAAASDRGIVVEYVLFCPFYEENLWAVNPMNARNNINGVGNIGRNEAYTGKHRDLQEKQEAFVRKAVRELNAFDNLYFEICNEPYFGGVTLEWQARIASVIVDTEKNLPRKHLIAQNIANEKAKIERPNPARLDLQLPLRHASRTVGMNYGLGKVIGDDETGFRGVADRPYRIEAWDFLVAGGAIFDHLDYSFTTDHENGTARIVDPTPGGGGPGFRSQLQILKGFIEGFDFVKMAPDAKVIGRVVPEKTSARALSEPGQAYAIYIHGGTKVELTLNLPAGRYQAEWLNPRTGKIEKPQEIQSRGSRVELASPRYRGGYCAEDSTHQYSLSRSASCSAGWPGDSSGIVDSSSSGMSSSVISAGTGAFRIASTTSGETRCCFSRTLTTVSLPLATRCETSAKLWSQPGQAWSVTPTRPEPSLAGGLARIAAIREGLSSRTASTSKAAETPGRTSRSGCFTHQ